MIPRDQAELVLYQILNQRLLPQATRWEESFGTKGLERDIIERGLQALEKLLLVDAPCVLHGWIDQAVLEIISIGPLSGLRDRAIDYRADQGGDTGILTLNDGKVVVLEISFERGKAALEDYGQVDLVSP